MTTKPKADSKKTTKSSDSKSADTKSSTTESSTSETSASSSDSGSSSGVSKSSSASSRPISCFSSVSTDDYRSGWDQIFSSGQKNAKSTPAKRKSAKRAKVNPLPLTVTLEAEDLDAEVRDQIEAIFRKQAKKKRLNYDKRAGNGQVSWHISCRISDN